MTSVAPSRLIALNRLRCSIFQTSYNPQSLRTGAKYLRARLRGPSMVNYYPEVPSIARLIKEFPDIGWENHAELVRFQDIADRKARGKGAPKKARSKGLYYVYYIRYLWTESCLISRGESKDKQEAENLIETFAMILIVQLHFHISHSYMHQEILSQLCQGI